VRIENTMRARAAHALLAPEELLRPDRTCDQDERMRRLAKRYEKATVLLNALGIEADKARLDTWVRVTEHVPLIVLLHGMKGLVTCWVREKGTPNPADLLEACRGPWSRYDDWKRFLARLEEDRRALPEGAIPRAPMPPAVDAGELAQNEWFER